MKHPLVIGLTGGIACGKSTVSRELARLGAIIVDADTLAHLLAQPGEALYEAYYKHFGPEAVTAEGLLDRQYIARRVFSSPEEKTWLDRTAHPIIRTRFEEELAAACDKQPPAVVLDVPLLFEAGWDEMADERWLVYATMEQQLRRLLARNGGTEEAARARIMAQMPLEEKRRRADFVLDNTGRQSQLLKQVRRLWKERVNVDGDIL